MTTSRDADNDRAAHPPMILGWREWVALPRLGVRRLKAKLDSGARSSALHVEDIESFRQRGVDWVAFHIVRDATGAKGRIPAEARVIDERTVRDSGGHEETRYVIETILSVAGVTWPIDVTLTERADMTFRMLLGRQALTHRVLIDPARSYLAGRPPRKR